MAEKLCIFEIMNFSLFFVMGVLIDTVLALGLFFPNIWASTLGDGSFHYNWLDV